MTKEITVFSTATCPWCIRLKQYLDSKGVKYKSVDVGVDQQGAMQMIQKSGNMGVPQMWINDEVVVGFDQKLIEKLLDL
jgi:glutaredoxin-like YruB-family protein